MGVLLMATCGCAERHARPLLPDVFVPSATVLYQNCKRISPTPDKCQKVTVRYRSGTEEIRLHGPASTR
jgi:hypothetical protein